MVLNKDTLPTANAIDSASITALDGKEVTPNVTICDFANSTVFTPASSSGLTLSGPEPTAQLVIDDESNHTLRQRIKRRSR